MITHPRLAQAIVAVRPGLRPNIDFVVQDDGDGPYLVAGSMTEPPSQAEVDAVTEEQLDFAQATKNGLPEISDVQFVAMLEQQGVVTHDQALAFIKTGEIPAPMQALIDDVADEAMRNKFELWIAGSTIFRRDHPAVALLQLPPFNMSDAQIDAFWFAASKL